MDEAVALERSLEAAPLDGGPSDGLARQLVWGCELDSARVLLTGCSASTAHATTLTARRR